MEHFEFINNKVICKECGSKDIYIRAGMFCDTYQCTKCGIKEFG